MEVINKWSGVISKIYIYEGGYMFVLLLVAREDSFDHHHHHQEVINKKYIRMEFEGKKKDKKEAAAEKEEVLWAPASPGSQYLKSSALSLTVVVIMETQVVPIDDSVLIPYIKDVIIPLNPRFSSIMVSGKWKPVEVNYDDHIIVPELCVSRNKEFYDEEIGEYITELGMGKLDERRPLWEIHILKYPSRNGQAGGTIIFRLHHSLGDGAALMGIVFSGLHPLHHPIPPAASNSSSHLPTSKPPSPSPSPSPSTTNSLPKYFNTLFSTLSDFGSGVLKSKFLQDHPSPIRSGRDGVEFRPVVVTTITFKLDSIKQIKNKLNVTINDVITGIIMLGTRLYMKQQSSSNANVNCNGLVLLNTRALAPAAVTAPNNNTMPSGNKFAFLHVPVPKLVDDTSSCKNSLKFISEVHKMIKRRRNPASVYLTGMLLDALTKLRGIEATAEYIHGTLRNSSFAISNVIGPSHQVALAGHPIKGFYFFVAGAPQSLAFLVLSYMGCLNVAVSVEKDFIDPNKFKSCIHTAFQSIFKDALGSYPPN